MVLCDLKQLSMSLNKIIFCMNIGVVEFLYDLVTRYGVAEIVMYDQGREFVNKVNQKLFQLCGTDHRISSTYHPPINGLDERMNQTLKGALVKFVNENQNDWDVHIKSILFTYRTSKNDSTKFIPFELMFGRAPICRSKWRLPHTPRPMTMTKIHMPTSRTQSIFREKSM